MTDQTQTPSPVEQAAEAALEEFYADQTQYTILAFLVDSLNVPAYRAYVVEQEPRESDPRQIIITLHMAIESAAWHPGSHGDTEPRLNLFAADEDGILSVVLHTRTEWNDLITEAVAHREMQDTLVGAFIGQ